ncbi:AbrB/MazE/SpoVT family DNA-binding domain-containing protein [Candidatus Bathyarchaeota archaeon]|jgi:AbrB family looped-hinge helix DNA binding protein|nr:AbrB/MazE/SpoVT family DNA-binding domain-containing protein [Candidatus Bathyarchaeota archaeon]
MASVYKVRVGKQGRIVLPKELREAYKVSTGDEAIIITNGKELNIHLHKVSEDPLQDLTELSKTISIGLSAEELKKKAGEERLKQFLAT